jgi:hypothetical protein
MKDRKPPHRKQPVGSSLVRRRFRAIAVAGVAVGVIAGAASLLSDNQGLVAETDALTAEELHRRAARLETPAYWVGPKPDTVYRLTTRSDDAVLVRYVPEATAYDSQPTLTVATYPRVRGLAEVEAAARRAGAVRIPLRDEAVASFDRAHPTNVFVAFPSQPVQVEVFDPVPGEARRLVESGALRVVGDSSLRLATPFVASEQELRRFARALPERAYWAGRRADRRYEVTHTSAGATFVRYLPPEAEVGDGRTRYLTVATYPRRFAFRVLRDAARAREAKTISLPGGGLGVYYRGTPTNVHLAFPGQDVEVEVFSPTKGAAIDLVRRGAIEPLS